MKVILLSVFVFSVQLISPYSLVAQTSEFNSDSTEYYDLFLSGKQYYLNGEYHLALKSFAEITQKDHTEIISTYRNNRRENKYSIPERAGIAEICMSYIYSGLAKSKLDQDQLAIQDFDTAFDLLFEIDSYILFLTDRRGPGSSRTHYLADESELKDIYDGIFEAYHNSSRARDYFDQKNLSLFDTWTSLDKNYGATFTFDSSGVIKSSFEELDNQTYHIIYAKNDAYILAVKSKDNRIDFIFASTGVNPQYPDNILNEAFADLNALEIIASIGETFNFQYYWREGSPSQEYYEERAVAEREAENRSRFLTEELPLIILGITGYLCLFLLVHFFQKNNKLRMLLLYHVLILSAIILSALYGAIIVSMADLGYYVILLLIMDPLAHFALVTCTVEFIVLKIFRSRTIKRKVAIEKELDQFLFSLLNPWFFLILLIFFFIVSILVQFSKLY